MNKIPQAVAMILLASALSGAQVVHQKHGPTKGLAATRGVAAVQTLLHEFLSKVDDPAMHERFWADDLIYVGAGGKVRTKEEIVKAVGEEAEKAKSSEAKQEGAADRYDAQDVTARQFGNTVVLNFRLVAKSADGKTSYYRNSGAFVNRNGKWQAVSWQATKEPERAQAAEQQK